MLLRVCSFARALPLAAALALAAGARAGEPAGTSPRAVAAAFYAALHRFDAEAAAALAEGPDARRKLSALVKLGRAYLDLEEAMGSRFGPEAARRVGYRAKSQAEAASVRAAREEVEGDRARVIGADDRVLATLTWVKGAWRMDLREAENLSGSPVALERDAEGSRRAAAEVTRRLAAGGYRDEDEALADFTDRADRAAEEVPWPGEKSL
jgi:hypothetical protein